jgi:hypothetical protein
VAGQDIYIFANHCEWEPYIEKGKPMKVFGFEGSLDGLAFDLVPVIDVDTNKIGLLDRLSFTLYENAGTGTFITGEETGEVIKEYVV